MASDLTLPTPDLWLLAAGRSVVAFCPRHLVDLNDELELEAGPARPDSELHSDFVGLGDPGFDDLAALVIGVQPASSLSIQSESHFLTFVPEGDVLILRVYRDNEPVLEEAEFEKRRADVEADFR